MLTCNRHDDLAIWQLSDSGILTRISLVSGSLRPLAGVGATASLHLDGVTTNRDGFITQAARG